MKDTAKAREKLVAQINPLSTPKGVKYDCELCSKTGTSCQLPPSTRTSPLVLPSLSSTERATCSNRAMSSLSMHVLLVRSPSRACALCMRMRLLWCSSKEHQQLDWMGIHEKVAARLHFSGYLYSGLQGLLTQVCQLLVPLRTPPLVIGSEDERVQLQARLAMRALRSCWQA
jgi:hypothetical protein